MIPVLFSAARKGLHVQGASIPVVWLPCPRGRGIVAEVLLMVDFKWLMPAQKAGEQRLLRLCHDSIWIF
jgi:hypothetical protein